MSLRWLRALLDHGIEVRGQIVVCPGVNDGDDPRRHDGRRPRRVPRAGVASPSCRSGSAEVQHRAGDAAAHHRPRRRRWSTPSRTGRTCSCDTLGRRMVFAADEYYLMAEPPVPGRRRVRRLPDARGRHRHGPHVRAGVPRAGRRTPTGRAARVLRRRRRRRRARPPYTALRQPAPRAPAQRTAPAAPVALSLTPRRSRRSAS